MRGGHLQTCCGLIMAALASATPLRREANVTMVHTFDDVQPSRDLNWVPCFETFECLKLQVPLDYADPSVGETIIAFMKIPSTNASAEDILYNPGGPGLSGISEFLQTPTAFTNLLTSEYNLVTFDPRGVNNSAQAGSISLDCFPNNTRAKVDFTAETNGAAVDSSSEKDLMETYLLNQGWGEQCSLFEDPNPGQPKGYANTVAVANDMRHYTELRAKQRGEAKPEESKLWYYGASYGTILGQTFATLFPDRVGRMALDGVVDTDDYYAGGWLTPLEDADASLQQFFADCLAVGPELCAFVGSSTTVKDLDRRFKAIVEDLSERPILVEPGLSYTPQIVDGQNLKRMALLAMYSPIKFPNLASTLAALEQRNGTLLFEGAGLAYVENPSSEDVGYWAAESTSQIACIDQIGRYNLSTLPDFKDHVAAQYNTSFIGGELWATMFTSTCSHYSIRPPPSQIFDKPVGAETANSILFISNSLDPVAAIGGARRSVGKFPGSVLLENNGTAHCGYGIPGKCLYQHVHAYFADATLPAEGTVCEPEVRPFVAVEH